MALVLIGQLTDKAWLPARYEAVVFVERAETREQRVDDPQSCGAPRQIMSMNTAGPCRSAGHIANVPRAFGFDGTGDVTVANQKIHLFASSDGQLISGHGKPHRLFVTGEGNLQLTIVNAQYQ